MNQTYKTTVMVFVTMLAVLVVLAGCGQTIANPFSIPTSTPAVAPTANPTAAPAPTAVSTLTPKSPSGSGIRGLVTRGPTCPGPQRPGQVCTQPYSATLVTTRRDGTEVARVTSGEDGRFTIDLPPGEYIIVPQTDPQSPFPRTGSVEATVQPGAFTEVDIEYDTGIR